MQEVEEALSTSYHPSVDCGALAVVAAASVAVDDDGIVASAAVVAAADDGEDAALSYFPQGFVGIALFCYRKEEA